MAPKRVNNCGECKNEFIDGDLSIECEICTYWFHIKCQNVNKQKYDFLVVDKTVHWYCNRCSVTAAKTMSMMNAIIQKQEATDLRLTGMEGNLKTLSTQVTSIEKNVSICTD